jgi:plexin A
MVLDRTTGKIYAGAVNRIYQLDGNLRVEEEVLTGPRLDSPFCHARGCDSDKIEKVDTNNVNKILVLDPESRTLVACGSLYQGACERYKIANISVPPKFIPMSIAANDEMSSTYAFIGPENYNPRGKNNVLYVGATFTNNGDYRHDVPAIASRSLYNLEIAEYSFSKQSLLRIDVKYRDHFLVKYVYGFNASDYAYFVIVQKQSHLRGQEEKGYVSRLARTCINDANYDSYTEVTLQCMVRNEETNELVNYNLIQDAKIGEAGAELAASLGIDKGDPVFVGVFSPSRGITNEPMSKSALCVYSLENVESKFNENIHMCFNGSIKDRNLGYISGLILDGMCPVAGVSRPYITSFCQLD